MLPAILEATGLSAGYTKSAPSVNQLTLRGGTLLTKYAVVLRTTGIGDFAEVDTIVGGTGGIR